MNRRAWLGLSSAASVAHLSGCRRIPKLDPQAHRSQFLAVVKQHAEVCSSAYQIAWQKADLLRSRVQLFLQGPSTPGMGDLRQRWTEALAAYMKTEGLRGRGTPALGLHPRIQAWPVDAAKMDTVPGKVKTGVVHIRRLLPSITRDALIQAHQPGTGNVLTGLHAIEFLIFGIDQYDDAGGYRAFTDYTKAVGAKRRGRLLQELVNLLSSDLKQLSDAWHPAERANYRAHFMTKPPQDALAVVFTGLTSACATGLDGKLSRPLASGDQRDEVCNFSDLSLDAIRYAITGLQNAMSGKAPSRVQAGEEAPLLGLISLADVTLANDIESGFASLIDLLKPLDPPFDQLIKPDNVAGRKALKSVASGLEKQHRLLGMAAKALGAHRPRSP